MAMIKTRLNGHENDSCENNWNNIQKICSTSKWNRGHWKGSDEDRGAITSPDYKVLGCHQQKTIHPVHPWRRAPLRHTGWASWRDLQPLQSHLRGRRSLTMKKDDNITENTTKFSSRIAFECVTSIWALMPVCWSVCPFNYIQRLRPNVFLYVSKIAKHLYKSPFPFTDWPTDSLTLP